MTGHNPQGFLGLDTDWCRGKAAGMRGQAQQMQGMMQQIQGMLDGVVWQGANADRFLAHWGGTLKPRLAESSEQVDVHGRELTRRCDLQDQASQA